MDDRHHIYIPVARSTRLYMRNQAGRVFIAALGQMNFLADPPGA